MVERGRTTAEQPKRIQRKRTKGWKMPPTYEELAQIVVDLADMNIANIHAPENAFVCCYTFGDTFPDHWLQAFRIRASLLANGIAKRGGQYKLIARDRARIEMRRIANAE